MDDAEEVSGFDDAGIALVRAYNYARDELDDNGKALSFLAGVSKSTRKIRFEFESKFHMSLPLSFDLLSSFISILGCRVNRVLGAPIM